MDNESYPIEETEKPFWLRPPWAVLFDLIKLQRVRPWDVNLSYLVTTLTGGLKRKGYRDCPAAVVALFSSVSIYRMKSELILQLQEPPTPITERPIEIIPPPIKLPFRYEYMSTTVDNLIQALDEALKSENFEELHPGIIPLAPTPPFVQELDEFMVGIDNKIENMYQNISQIREEVVALSKLTAGLKRLEAIRVFILVLFLACRGKIQLWQDENFGEIYMSIIRHDQDGNEARVKA